MVMARRNLMAGGGAPTARDYVQDGLVAMWDGVENAGWGVHDPNATTWKDLLGSGYDIGIGDNYFDDKSVVTNDNVAWLGFYRNHPLTASWFDGVKDCTIEFVLNCESIFPNSNICHAFSLNINDCVIGVLNYGGLYAGVGVSTFAWSIGIAKVDIGSVFGRAFSVSISFVKNGNSYDVLCYLNGSYVRSSTNSKSIEAQNDTYMEFNRRGFNGHHHAYRFYSGSALTAAEIAANYAVDKARFGLP